MDLDSPPDAVLQVIRRLTPGRDAPYPADLVATAGGILLRVDASAFDESWPGWRAESDGHVLAPVDVVRRGDGHDVLLPRCREPLAGYLARRRDAQRPLEPGELVTLGVSLARGIAELGDDAGGDAGQWWLSDQGRPVIAMGAGDAGARSAAVDIAAAADPGGDPVWSRLRDTLGEARLARRELEEVESALFGTAPAEPLRPDDWEPRTARSLASATDARPDRREGRGLDSAEDGWVLRAARAVDADAADIAARVGVALWRGARGRRGRIGAWGAAAAAAVVTVAVGLLWPVDDAGSSAAAQPASSPATAEPAADAAPVRSDDPGEAAEQLLARRSACSGDPVCLGSVQEDPGTRLAGGAIDLADIDRVVVVLDDLGDVAVLRVAGRDDAVVPQIVVIARGEDEWLLRDVYDVAQQP